MSALLFGVLHRSLYDVEGRGVCVYECICVLSELLIANKDVYIEADACVHNRDTIRYDIKAR